MIEIGVLLELKGENPFKTRAYTNAARIVESLDETPLAADLREHAQQVAAHYLRDALLAMPALQPMLR